MRFEVRIYTSSEQEQSRHPVATVVISDQREPGCWLPKPVAAEARFFLTQVEAESKRIEQQIRSALQRHSITVAKSISHISEGVRIHGDYWAEEPYGTPAYWRAAIGRLESEAGLTYDLEDYGQILEEMEAAVPAH